MSKVLKIKRGADIKLVGEAEKILVDAPIPDTIAVKPSDFGGTRAKVIVKPGDEVQAGSVLFFDKDQEEVKFTSPVSGEVAEVRRGDKRKLLEVIVVADKEIKYNDFKAADPSSLNREQIIEKMCASEFGHL